MSDDNVTQFRPPVADNRVLTPEALLRREHEAMRSGDRQFDSAIVLYLDRDTTRIHYAASNMSLLEVLGLLEAAKAAIIYDDVE